MEMVRSARQQAFTPPKHREPVTTSLPDGAKPETANVRGPAGSSLVTVIVADLGPKLVGWRRIGTCREPPASTLSGYDKMLGTRNSAEEEVMPVIVSVQCPLLLKDIISSTKDAMHAFPKLP